MLDVCNPTGYATVALIVGTLVYLFIRRSNAKNAAEARKRFLDFHGMRNPFLSTFMGKPAEVLELEYDRKYGPTFATHVFNAFTIMSTEPEFIQKVLSTEFTNFMDRRRVLLNVRVLSKLLSIVNGDDWKRLRSIVTPTFSSGKLRRMKPCLDDTICTLIKNFDNSIKDNNEVSIKKLAGAFTMDTIIQVAFGIKVDSLLDVKNPVLVNARKAFSLDISVIQIVKFMIAFAIPSSTKYFSGLVRNPVFDYFEEFSEKIINEKRKEYQNKENVGKASNFLELLLEAEAEGIDLNNNANSGDKGVKFMTNEEIVAQCMLFFLAGYDTTATTITLALYQLALNPSKQEKLYKEIVDRLEQLEKETGESDPVKLVTMDELNNFKYLSATIEESLRLYPPATTLERTAKNDIVLETSDGKRKVKVMKDDVFRIPVYALHYDERQFPDPKKFQPERFIEEPTFHKYAYMPFGSGPRNCVAKRLALMEAKLAILNVIKNYKVETGPNTTIPVQFYKQANFLSPKEVLLKVTKR